jgi:hypothetical protein
MKLSEVCRLEIQTGEPDSFILSHSEFDDATIGLAGLEDFILDVNSVLDEDQFDGGSFFFQNVLNDAAQVSINRGMILGTGATPYAVAGSVNAVVRSKVFDPFYTPQYKTGAKCRFTVNFNGVDYVSIFEGRLRSINSEYDVDGGTLVQFEATDAIDDLGKVQLNAVSFPQENTGERMQAIMVEAGYATDLIPNSSGHSYDLAAETITNNALEACEIVNDHELGALLVTKGNQIQFLTYGQTNTPEVANPIFTNKTIDSNNKISMTDVGMSSGKELFFNKVIAKTENDATIYEDTATVSVQRHGEVPFRKTDLNFHSAGGAGSASTAVNEYMDRFLERWSDIPNDIQYTDPRRYARRAYCVNRTTDFRYPVIAEIGDKVTIDFETEFVDVNQESMIMAITHDIDPDRWLSTFDLIPVPNT